MSNIESIKKTHNWVVDQVNKTVISSSPSFRRSKMKAKRLGFNICSRQLFFSSFVGA